MSALGQKRTYASQQDDVCFTPDSDGESELPQTVMSALPPKADMCGAARNVRFGPKADIHSITSSARCCRLNGTDRPSVLAVFRLMAISYVVGACTGRSAGFSPLRIRSTYPAARRY